MQITIRGIDPALGQILKRISRIEGISLNKAALRLLAKGAGLQRDAEKPGEIGGDLDHLFGTWSEEEARAFLNTIRSCEQIDESFWT
jgi:hypothetical protein